MIVVLTGGSGGAKLIAGLAAATEQAELTIICNTGDDCIFHGLYISPDVDTIIYTLAGMSDDERGWGIKGDTFTLLAQLARMGSDTWFKLGDRDLATHITRTRWLNEGLKLSQATDRIRRALSVRAAVLPMSDERVETRVLTPQGEISFQEYFVKERWSREVTGVRFAGAETSRPASGVREAIRGAQTIIICPSNPVTSIGPILAVPGIRDALIETQAKIIAVSPLIGQSAISGPADKLMTAVAGEASVKAVANQYRGFLDVLLVAAEDEKYAVEINKLGIVARTADIRMKSPADKRRVAREVLALVKK